MYHKMKIAGLERALPVCRVTDDLYIAGFVIFGDVELTEKAACELLKKAPDFDVIITAESKGIPLAHEMARQSGKPYVVARKAFKLYMKDVVTVKVKSISTEKEQTLCLGADEIAKMKGKKVLIVDDVISTGESLRAIEYLVDEVGGKTVGKMTILAEGDAIDRPDIIALEPLPLFNADGTVKE